MSNWNEARQLEAFEKLSRLKVGALFMGMGTGKTKVALDLIASKRHKVDYVLWVCPYSLRSEIEAERLKWHPEIEMDVVGCESIGQSERIYMETLDKVKNNKTFMVVDESLKIKNISAKRTKRILMMGDYAKYKLILNGTPLTRNVLDVYTQMQFLSPKILNMSYSEYRDTYCEYYTRGKLKGKVRRNCNIKHLVSVIEPYIFESELSIDKDKGYRSMLYYVDKEAYDAYKDELFWEYYDDNNDDLNFYAFSSKLQHWYCQTTEAKEALQEMIQEIDNKVIVFVRYLDSVPAGAMAITGDVPERKRREIIKAFRDGGDKVLYITYGCGAFGLNLQFCHHTIFAEQVWDYANIEQAEARTYRIGQDNDVTYHYLYCGNSGLEDMIIENIRRKGNLLQTVKEEIQNTKGGAKEWVKRI